MNDTTQAADKRAIPDGMVLEQRRFFDDVMGARPVGGDVRMTQTELGGIAALQVTIDGLEPRGTMLWFHGGGYVAASARTAVAPAANVARAAKVRVLSVDYRLAPEHPFPAAVLDALTAYRALLENVPVKQIVVGGESAGGGLVIAMLIAARDAGLPMPRAVVTFSPLTDLTFSGESTTTKADVDPVLSVERLTATVAAYIGGSDARLPLLSPLFADLSKLPPLLIQVGSFEVLLDDSVRLAARAAAVDIAVSLQVARGMSHVFQSRGTEETQAVQALECVGAFVDLHLGR
jgi:epsilon-lactone hydrolase